MSSYRLAFYCGESSEPWSPQVVNRGVGGSQESLMAVAATLAKLGHSVRVYNSCGSGAGEHDGVIYEDYRAFASRPPIDLVIVWRLPWLGEAVPANLPAVLWMKDMIAPAPVIARAHRFRKILIQSRFHRRYYPVLPEEKFFYTSNGIQVEHFDQTVARDPLKVVFGSSYDRGLFPLLDAWPRVQKEIPQAHLTVFYGLESSRARAFQLRRPTLKSYWQINPLRYWKYRHDVLSALRRSNANHLGRIGHLEVARQYLSAGVWAYPTTFPETSCITAMKAQAAGAVPVVIASGAVDETVQFGFKTTSNANDYADRKLPRRVYEEWEALLISSLRDTAKLEALRAPMMAATRRRYAWTTIASEWTREFGRILSEETGAIVALP